MFAANRRLQTGARLRSGSHDGGGLVAGEMVEGVARLAFEQFLAG